ncbi:hypothetical protein [Alcaligenes faecalis]|uniref:hypothetical protein n=1 Tax=Alcaligenes faecalis TaxID=511 RepID=UPI0024BC6001|nr:hypothetical protein [Alcaligenes faecalis]WHQ45973.1 hypothetical protein E8D21_20235 [Alcaligenes faecalis]
MIIQDASATSDWTKEMLDELHVNLQPLEDCDFECDGMTYAIATALERAGITHRRMVGHVWNPGQDVIDPHCWIELANGVVIDFRLRMWVGDDDAVPTAFSVFSQTICSMLARNRQPNCLRGKCLKS